jgi:HPt (histidine-containing phosphotransfer) domain-containing protein
MQVEVESWLAELIPRFLHNRVEELDALERAAAAGDAATLKWIAHRLRGAAAGFGFVDLAELGARLEGTAETAGAEELRALVAAIADHVRTVEVVYR